MKKISDLKKVFINLELEGEGHSIIMGVTRLILLGPFSTYRPIFYISLHMTIEIVDAIELEIEVGLQTGFEPIFWARRATLRR